MFQKMRQNNGFTLLSVLIALSIFLIMAPFFSTLLTVFTSTLGKDLDEEFSVSTFFYLLQEEFHSSNEVQITNSGLILHQAYENIVYIEHNTTYIRRRVNYTGHEILLFNVKRMEINEEPQSLLIKIETEGGNVYERRFVLLPIKN